MKQTFAIGIGGAAGQGVATPLIRRDPRVPLKVARSFVKELMDR